MNRVSTITTDALHAILGQQGLKILDCSVARGRQAGDCQYINYHKQHIPGAQFIDLDNFRDMTTDLPFMMPNEAQFIHTMKRHNIKLSDHVVCYDTSGMQFFGFRVAWMLYAMGHENFQVLAGGFPKWLKEGKPIKSFDDSLSEKDFNYKLNPDRIKFYNQIKEFSDSDHKDFQLIDVRNQSEFKKGHIPGSINLFYENILDQNKDLLPADERKALFESGGIDLNKDIVVTCMTGNTASVMYSGLLGLAKGKLALYDGSYSEWIKKKNI